MPKLPLIITAASLVGLASCTPPPPPPPPRFHPNPPYAPEPVDPYGTQQPNPASPPPVTPPVQPPSVTGGYPTATRTENPDQVISPYEPYNVIDISGPPRIESGQLARDPSNRKIFRVP
jgi:hypothetical protein